ncbi:MAG: protein DinB [Cyclobacteriaceae bacterium]|nr:MAG: protein DinB [Cyclobacteriaceae bacterium]
MKAYFYKLFKYNQWANNGLCRHLMALANEPIEVKKRMSHIVAAEEIWYGRIVPLDFQHLAVFDIQPWDILEPRLTASAQRWLDLVENTGDFEKVINYQNLSGRAFTSTMSDIMIHITNHGTYHRGQIATLLRQNGLEPLPTDYIIYSRTSDSF